MNRPFRVVTHKNWLAKQFESLGAVQDYGFDINPDTAPETIWWAPGAWVASAHKAGVKLPLLSCGASWLPNLPRAYTGRIIQNRSQWLVAPGASTEVFVKLPEAKLDVAPAALYRTGTYLRETLRQYHLPEDTVWQISERMDFRIEIRFWVAYGSIKAHSFYRIDDLIWGEPDFPQGLDADLTYNTELNDAVDLVESLVVDPEVSYPPGFVLDVGINTHDNRPYVVEANAAWSSGPYDGRPKDIYETIVAAHDFDGMAAQWAWNPNPALYSKAGPLKVVNG